MKVVENCGHVIQEDQPETVAQHIKEFVEVFKFPAEYDQKFFIVNASGVKIYIGR